MPELSDTWKAALPPGQQRKFGRAESGNKVRLHLYKGGRKKEMIYLINGGVGVGKTSLACCLANRLMLGDIARERVTALKRENKLQSKYFGRNLFSPKDHLVFSDYKFFGFPEWGRPVETWDFDGWDFGLPNPYRETMFIPKFSSFFFIEGQKYFESLRCNSFPLPSWVTRAFERHRHRHIFEIYIDCQRPVSIAKGIRALADRFIFPLKKNDSYDKHGNLIRTNWECIEFRNTDDAERYDDSRAIASTAEKTEYVFHGNVHACYDSHGYNYCFENVPEGADYTLTKNKRADYDLYYSSNDLELDYDIPEEFLTKTDKLFKRQCR